MVIDSLALFMKNLRWQKQTSISCPYCPPWRTLLIFSMRKNNRKPKKVTTHQKCREPTALKISESRYYRVCLFLSFHFRRVDKLHQAFARGNIQLLKGEKRIVHYRIHQNVESILWAGDISHQLNWSNDPETVQSLFYRLDLVALFIYHYLVSIHHLETVNFFCQHSSISHRQDATLSSCQAKKEIDGTKTKEKSEESKKWAIPVNITSPCDDFYKRIPNPAFQASSLIFFHYIMLLLYKVKFVPVCF